jgi:MFS family permease
VAGLRVYRELLGNRPLVRLLLGEFVSGIGDWLYIVAIFVVIYNESGNAALVGLFGAIRLLPYVVLSVPAGIIADRFDRRMVLLVSDLYRGSLMVLMAVVVATGGSTALLATLAILAACGSSFFYPAMGAYLPALAKDEQQLGPANSAWASLQNVSYIAGPAIGGLVLAFGSVTTAFVVNALTFAFIAVILWSLPPSRARDRAGAVAPAVDGAGASAAAPEGVQAGDVSAPAAATAPGPAETPLQLRPLGGLVVVQLMAGFLGGGFQVITVILAIDVLNAGEQANGYLNAAIGIGGLLGAIAAGGLVLRRGMGVPLIVGALVTGLGTIALGAAGNLPLALLTIGIAAAGALIIDVVTTTIFQRLIPDRLRGRATGILMALSTVTGAAGAFLMPVLLIAYGPWATLGVSGLATIVLTGVGLVMIGSAADRPPTPYEATIARVIKLPLFAGVSAARLEAAMKQVVEVPVTAGVAVVRQGEPADRFYIIESGTFSVTQVQAPRAEPALLRQLGPDQVFGEIGLLNRSSRTATVTAETDGLLLALDGDEFLDLVGASGQLRQRLLGLYAGGGASR